MIKYLVIDVDGTMTDSGIYYDESGNEIKKFCVRDAAGIFAAHSAGIKLLVLTGRECNATLRRMQELKIDFLYQNVKDKLSFLNLFMEKNGIQKEDIGYIGDDLNDYSSMLLCGYVACPSDSCKEIKALADYVSHVKGGKGAVRDIIENYLEKYGLWEESVRRVYNIGV